MLQNYSKWKVLRIFFENPAIKEGFGLREISKEISLAHTSVKKYLLELIKEGLILQKKTRAQKLPVYIANRGSELFKQYKKIDTLDKIYSSGIIQKIEEMCLPDSIILFGSATRGEDVGGSDIDIYVQSKEHKIKLEKYEKFLKRKINLFFEPNFTKLSSELKNNLLNGIVLHGYIKVF